MGAIGGVVDGATGLASDITKYVGDGVDFLGNTMGELGKTASNVANNVGSFFANNANKNDPNYVEPIQPTPPQQLNQQNNFNVLDLLGSWGNQMWSYRNQNLPPKKISDPYGQLSDEAYQAMFGGR